MHISDKGLALIKEFEGFRAKAYPDPATGKEPFTIGIGTTVYPDGRKVKLGDTCNETQAMAWLRHDVEAFERHVPEGTQNQFDAMVSLTYNVGPGNFAKSSVKRLHLAKDFKGAQAAFASWNKANKKVMAGLTRRRAAEAKLYGTI